MVRNRILSIAISVAAWTTAYCATAAGPQQDFSKIDPSWGANEIDKSFRSGDLGSAWTALKAVFPQDYNQLIINMSKAVIQHQDWSTLSQAFIQNHMAAKVSDAQRAPALSQAEYQRQKAKFLTYISKPNTAACAYLGTGRGDPAILGRLSIDEMRHYSDLIAATVQTIGAGRKAPTTYGALNINDVTRIKSIMVAQGVTAADQQVVLSGKVGETSAELCHAGVVRNTVLAAAPPEIVAKAAFR